MKESPFPLENLPNDILKQILHLLPNADAKNAALVSKRFHKLAPKNTKTIILSEAMLAEPLLFTKAAERHINDGYLIGLKLSGEFAKNSSPHGRALQDEKAKQCTNLLTQLVSTLPVNIKRHITKCHFANSFFSTDVILSIALHFPLLSRLILSNCQLKDVKKMTDFLGHCPPLRMLHLNYCEEGDFSIDTMIEAIACHAPHLTSLGLARATTPISNDSLQKLLTDCTQLKALNLSGWTITKELTEAMSSLPHLASLTLNYNTLSEDILTTLLQHPTLEEITLPKDAYIQAIEILAKSGFPSSIQLQCIHLTPFSYLWKGDIPLSSLITLYERYPEMDLPDIEQESIMAAKGIIALKKAWEGKENIVLSNHQDLRSEQFSHALPSLHAVTHLDMTGYNFGLDRDDLPSLTLADAVKQYCPNLSHLTLSDDLQIHTLLHNFPKLRTLTIPKTSATFPPLYGKQFPLTSLTIRDSTLNVSEYDNEIIPYHLKNLIDACPLLRHITLSSKTDATIAAGITDHVLAYIAKRCKYLHTLDIGISNVSDKTIIALYQKLPGLELTCLSKTEESLAELKKHAQEKGWVTRIRDQVIPKGTLIELSDLDVPLLPQNSNCNSL